MSESNEYCLDGYKKGILLAINHRLQELEEELYQVKGELNCVRLLEPEEPLSSVKLRLDELEKKLKTIPSAPLPIEPTSWDQYSQNFRQPHNWEDISNQLDFIEHQIKKNFLHTSGELGKISEQLNDKNV